MKNTTIIFTTLLFLIIISCKQKEEIDKCNFIYQPLFHISMKYNFNADSLYINHFKIKAKVKLNLKQKERLMLQQLFFKYKFDTINKDIEVHPENGEVTSFNDFFEIIHNDTITHSIGYSIGFYAEPINKPGEEPLSRFSIKTQDFEKEKNKYYKEHINLIRFKLKLDSILYQNETFVKWNNYRIRYSNKIFHQYNAIK